MAGVPVVDREPGRPDRPSRPRIECTDDACIYIDVELTPLTGVKSTRAAVARVARRTNAISAASRRRNGLCRRLRLLTCAVPVPGRFAGGPREAADERPGVAMLASCVDGSLDGALGV